MEKYNISLKQFEGPLDLLLHLIEKAELDIKDVFISEITSQYIEYVNAAQELDMDMSSEFITMAARLLYIKSRSLLPKPPREQTDEEEEDPEEVLIRQLKEYKAYKLASQKMAEINENAGLSYAKLPEEFILPDNDVVFLGGTPEDLFNAFREILNRADDGEEQKILTHEVTADVYTIRSCASDIREALMVNDNILFEQIFEGTRSRMRMIVTFMALLEMIMRGEICVSQSNPYDPIIISKRDLSTNDTDDNYMDEEMGY